MPVEQVVPVAKQGPLRLPQTFGVDEPHTPPPEHVPLPHVHRPPHPSGT